MDRWDGGLFSSKMEEYTCLSSWKARYYAVLLGLFLGAALDACDIPIGFAFPPSFPNKRTSQKSRVVGSQTDGSSKKKVGRRSFPSKAIPDRLVDTLDLSILIEGVSRYTGSRRGRQALLSLANEQFDETKRNEPSHNISAKRRRVSQNFPKMLGFEAGRSRYSHLSPMALSAEEARTEFQLVEQAMRCLQETDRLSYPDAIYGSDSSPWDTQRIAATDYDDWLRFITREEWSLEHVLQAEQVIGTLLHLYDWANLTPILTFCPGLAQIGQQIRMADLRLAQSEVAGTVAISRVRTYIDPNGRSVGISTARRVKDPSLSIFSS
jgi:hypothetical protein